MATDFFYFISSLPALSPDSPAPFDSYDAFLQHAEDYLSDAEMAVLKHTGLCPAEDQSFARKNEILDRWARFETFVRNFLAKFRAGKLKWNHGGDLRHCPDFFAGTARQLETLLAENNMAAREKKLDQMRWEQLDDWKNGHEFDFSAVVIYALRLCILMRHDAAPENKGKDVLAAMLDQAVEEAAAVRVDVHTA